MTRNPMVRTTTPKRSDGFISTADKTFTSKSIETSRCARRCGPCSGHRRHLHLHAVANGEAHEPLAHFAGNGCQHLMLVVQLDPEHCPGQNRHNAPLNFDVFFHESSKPARWDAAEESGNLRGEHGAGRHSF